MPLVLALHEKLRSRSLFHEPFLQIGWLNAIREWQEEFVGNMSSREFVDTVTRDLLGSRVFVFTPRGEVRWIMSYTTRLFSSSNLLKIIKNAESEIIPSTVL